MDKYNYMSIYTTALMECIMEPNVTVFYDDEKGELRVIKDDVEVYFAKSHDIDYDTKAKLLIAYIRERISDGKTY